MSRRSRAQRRQREAKAARQAERRASKPRAIPWKPIASWGALAAGGGLLAFALIAGTGGSSAEADPLVADRASDAADSNVQVYRGSAHTVYHSTAPLPSASAPRADGRPTLVWFSGTWCHVCEGMEPFALDTAEQFTDRMVFAEKSVDHDRGASSRFAVRGTPTFLLIDAEGVEITRFYSQPSGDAFAAAIEAALQRAGA